MVEIERRQPETAWKRGIRGEPAKPAGDHQVDGEAPLRFEPEEEPFAEPSDGGEGPAVEIGEGRGDGAQQERRGDAHGAEDAAPAQARDVFAIDFEVGQFRHPVILQAPGRRPSPERRAAV